MKTLKSIIPLLMIALLIVSSSSLQAQDKGESEEVKRFKHKAEQFERMRSLKIAFISESLELTPAEAEKFWPVYNEMENKRESITHDLMKQFFYPEERPEDISDDMAEEMMQKRFKKEQMLLDLKIEYHKKLTGIISPVKVLKLYEAEQRFKKGLMERIGRRDGDRKPEGRGVAEPCRSGRLLRR